MSNNTMRARILRVLDKAPEGLTCKQIERMTGVRHSTASAALTGLAGQMRVFRLAGFTKPYHWVTPENLRGRPVIGKHLGAKDRYIADLERLLDYPTKPATLPLEQDRAEQEEHLGAHA